MPSAIYYIEKMAETVFPEDFVQGTDDKLKSTNIALSGAEYCGVSLILGIVVGVGIFVASFFVSFPLLPAPVYSVVAFILTFIVLSLMLPFVFIERRVGELEESLPDALRQMSTTLRAGVSMDGAFEDVAESDYGALSEEFERTLAQVRRGRSMSGAIRAMAERSKSDLFERAFFLIVEGMERGAEIADVMEAVSEDIRETHSIQRERQSSTMQQIMFLLAAALFAAPFITGLVVSLGGIFSEVIPSGVSGAGGAAGGAGITQMGGNVLPSGTRIIVPIFLAIESSITALAVGVIRYGDVIKGMMYIAPFAAAALLVFYVSQFAAGFMF